MRAHQFLVEKFRVPPHVSDEDRAEMLIFMTKWFGGSYMVKRGIEKKFNESTKGWEKFHSLFPHKLSGSVKFYRVITLPISFVDQQHFHLPKPALGPIASWSIKKTGMMFAAGVAREQHASSKTCRVGIETTFDAADVLADTSTIRSAVFSMVADFPWNKLDGDERDEIHWLGRPISEWEDKHDLGHLSGHMDAARGGYYNQWECIVRTKPVDCRIIKKFRIGNKTIEDGWEF
jgi:hypothetical protein